MESRVQIMLRKMQREEKQPHQAQQQSQIRASQQQGNPAAGIKRKNKGQMDDGEWHRDSVACSAQSRLARLTRTACCFTLLNIFSIRRRGLTLACQKAREAGQQYAVREQKLD